MKNTARIMGKIASCWMHVKKTLIERLGDVDVRSQYNNYWRSVEYIGPFEREYDGKLCYGADLNKILSDAELLQQFVRTNELIGFKHRTSENKPDDPFYGQLPIMLVYATFDERENVLKILKRVGVTEMKWIANPSYLDPFKSSAVARQMNVQHASSPYTIK